MQNFKQYFKNEYCPSFKRWASKYSTIKEVWDNCPRADWLLWLLEKIGNSDNVILFAACDMIESVLHLVSDDHPKKTIEIVKLYLGGQATETEVIVACDSLNPNNILFTYFAGETAANIVAKGVINLTQACMTHIISVNYHAQRIVSYVYKAFYLTDTYISTDIKSIIQRKLEIHKKFAGILRKRIPWKCVENRIKNAKSKNISRKFQCLL